MKNSVDNILTIKLDKIIRLIAIQVASDKSLTERARLLKFAGLDNKTIADVLNTTEATIRTLTSNLRKSQRSMRKK